MTLPSYTLYWLALFLGLSGTFLWVKVVDFLSGIHSWHDGIFTFQEICLHLWYQSLKHFWAAGYQKHTTQLLIFRTQTEWQSANYISPPDESSIVHWVSHFLSIRSTWKLHESQTSCLLGEVLLAFEVEWKF